MINLYQRHDIKRSMVRNHDLKNCKLAFWFCTLENGVYIPVSPVYYSDPIKDRKIQELFIFNLLILLFFQT
jgi:hypothetical protein